MEIRENHGQSDRTNVSNYRLISVLSTLSKILERAVHLQLCQYLMTNDFWSNKQYGFRKGFSTTRALTSFANEVLLNMKQKKLCGAVFIDLTKAFDMLVTDGVPQGCTRASIVCDLHR